MIPSRTPARRLRKRPIPMPMRKVPTKTTAVTAAVCVSSQALSISAGQSNRRRQIATSSASRGLLAQLRSVPARNRSYELWSRKRGSESVSVDSISGRRWGAVSSHRLLIGQKHRSRIPIPQLEWSRRRKFPSRGTNWYWKKIRLPRISTCFHCLTNLFVGCPRKG